MLPWQRNIADRETAHLTRAVANWASDVAGRARAEAERQVVAMAV